MVQLGRDLFDRFMQQRDRAQGEVVVYSRYRPETEIVMGVGAFGTAIAKQRTPISCSLS